MASPTVSLHNSANDIGERVYSCSRIAQMIGSATLTVGLIATKVSGITKSYPLLDPLASIAIGITAQHCIQESLRRKHTIVEQSFLADHDAEIFLIASQIYLNLPRSAFMGDAFFTGLNVLFGMSISAFVHSFVTRKLGEQQQYVPLDTDQRPAQQTLSLPWLNKFSTRVPWAVSKTLLGVALAIAGVTIPRLQLLSGLGVYAVGNGISQLVSERAYQKASQSLEREGFSAIIPYKRVLENLLALGTIAPGICLSAAAILSKQISVFPSFACYFLAGAFTGVARHTERLRFTTIPKHHLREIKEAEFPKNCMEKAFHVAKWIIGTVGVGGFIGLGLAGFDVPSWSFKSVQMIDRISLIAFGATLYGSYPLAKIASDKFSARNLPPRFWNALYFSSHFSQGIPLLYLYTVSQIQIGNQALATEPLALQVAAAVAYASLGMAMGFRAASRGEFVKPRIMSALSAALFGNFIVWELYNRSIKIG